jgi:hypothetical protein
VKAGNVVSTEFKAAGHPVYLFGTSTLNDYEGHKAAWSRYNELVKAGKICVEKLGDTGADMQASVSVTPAVAMTAYEDWAHDGSDPEAVCRTVWYNCANYRANLFLKGSRLYFRDIYKFDDRYTERYLDKTCEAWDALYDNLPMVNGRLQNENGQDAAVEFALPVSYEGFTCVEHDQTLEVIIPFANGTTGRIWLAPEGITITDCGEMTYVVVDSHDTETAYTDGAFRFVHNGYAYEIPVGGQVESAANGYRLTDENGTFKLNMIAR